MAGKDAPTHPWLIDRRDFLLIIVSVFFIISSITLFICHRHHAIEVEQTLGKDRSDANLLSLILEQRAMAAITFLLFMSIVLFLAYLRKQVTTQHIREQLQTEKKIRAGVERYKSYIDVTMQLAWTTNDKGEVVEDNPSWSKYTGRGYEEIKGFGWMEDIHPDDRDHAKKVWRKAVADKSSYETEYRLRRYDGIYRDYLVRGIPLLAEKGNVYEWVGACIDISDRKQMENIIRTRLRVVEFAAHHSLDELLRRTVDEVCAMTDSPIGFYHFVEPDQKTLSLQAWSTRTIQKYCKAEGEGLHYGVDQAGVWVDCIHQRRPVIHNDYASLPHRKGLPEGHAALVRELVVPIFREDRIVAILGIGNRAQDYTENDINIVAYFADEAWEIASRKRVEEQLQRQGKLLAAINAVFFETLTADSEEVVAKTCLKVAQELTDSKFGFLGEITPNGLFTTTALTDPGWEACRIPKTQANMLMQDMVIRGIWGQVILKEQSLTVNDPVSYPDRAGIPEGHPPLTSFLGVPLIDQRKVIGMIAMANRESGYTADHQQDIEALSVAFVEAIRRKKAEKEILRLNIELEQRVIERTTELEAVNKELVAFSYSVSHDLRAPLRSIDGFSQILIEKYQDKPLDDKGKTYLERVRKATQQMGLLIDDMLDLSRITQAELKRKAFDLSAMIRAIVKEHQKSNPDRVVDVTVSDGVMVLGDPHLVKIAMENLVGNAFKFTGKKEHPRIEFGTAVRDGETACFIRDNGAGFEMAHANKLFGAFQRLHTADEFPGTGIGLATVQRIIHRHGGQVWAEGEKGKGATFYFTAPS